MAEIDHAMEEHAQRNLWASARSTTFKVVVGLLLLAALGPWESCQVGCRNTDSVLPTSSQDQSASNNQADPRMGLIDTKLLLLSRKGGGRTLNCGWVGIRRSPDASSDCALKAFANGSPFYVRDNFQGIDSDVSMGLAGDGQGHVYFVEYDSMGWGTEGPEGSELTDDRHIYTEPCPRPVTLRKTRTGRLTCAKNELVPTNIMSPTIEPY